MNQQLQMVLKAWNIFKMTEGISWHKECTCLHVPACWKELVEDYSRGSRSAKIFCVKDSWLLLCRMFFQKLLAKGWGDHSNSTWVVCTRSLQQDVAGCRCWDACLYLSRNDWDCGRAETVVSLDQEKQSKLFLRFGYVWIKPIPLECLGWLATSVHHCSFIPIPKNDWQICIHKSNPIKNRHRLPGTTAGCWGRAAKFLFHQSRDSGGDGKTLGKSKIPRICRFPPVWNEWNFTRQMKAQILFWMSLTNISLFNTVQEFQV